MSVLDDGGAGVPAWRIVHPWPVRVAHWVNAAALFLMIGSGWRIYDASPFLAFTFPPEFTLGGWLAGAIAVHLAAMWLLLANALFYAVYSIASGRWRRRLWPVTSASVARDLAAALRFRLAHRPGRYNAIQRLLYLGVMMAVLLAMLSGLAVWKPVELQSLAALMGGYEGARRVHFCAMSLIVLFIVIHLALVLLVPKTLPPMITGRARIVVGESEP